uniref:TFIIS N-terminal domain-containing protein n=1 Tax=Oryza meridionalis TaxID=40149 RepID=A0A0E0CUR1_9ORYZ
QTEAELLCALQQLEFTVDAIRVTEIGTAVKPLRKHVSKQIRQLGDRQCWSCHGLRSCVRNGSCSQSITGSCRLGSWLTAGSCRLVADATVTVTSASSFLASLGAPAPPFLLLLPDGAADEEEDWIRKPLSWTSSDEK